MRTTRLPGFRRERQLRFWSVSDVCQRTGLSWATVQNADDGGEINFGTARKLVAALEASPPTETMRSLAEAGS